MVTEVPDLEYSIDIEAAPADVWALVHDVRRMPEWSPQVTSVRLRDGFDEVALGAQFTNRNVQDALEWTTHAEVTAFVPDQEIAFKVTENWVTWSFHLEAVGPGTRLTQRRVAPDGVSDLSRDLADAAFGSMEPFTEITRAGMQQTLERIKTAAESE